MDIVEKLRKAAAPDGWAQADQRLLDDAAAEIERLRAELSRRPYAQIAVPGVHEIPTIR